MLRLVCTDEFPEALVCEPVLAELLTVVPVLEGAVLTADCALLGAAETLLLLPEVLVTRLVLLLVPVLALFVWAEEMSRREDDDELRPPLRLVRLVNILSDSVL